jgi:two-component system chemotaxis response regulator CheY
MTKRVLDVGNCYFDHSQISGAISDAFDAELELASKPEEVLPRLRQGSFDLVLVNRTLHGGTGDGVDLIRQIKSDPELAGTPVMLLSDYEEYQQAAVAAGAEPGFGKSGLKSEDTREKLARFLMYTARG